MELVKLRKTRSLDDYASFAHLARSVQELRAEAATLSPRLKGRTVVMVNSVAHGGGVAEMLPTQVLLLRELGVAARWAVISSDQPEFFKLTKQTNPRWDYLLDSFSRYAGSRLCSPKDYCEDRARPNTARNN
jgi:trehalose synthase